MSFKKEKSITIKEGEINIILHGRVVERKKNMCRDVQVYKLFQHSKSLVHNKNVLSYSRHSLTYCNGERFSF